MVKQPHLLTTSETAGLFVRHPLEAENIAQTKILISSGLYDWTQWIPGTIPPWGTQFQDSEFGTTTVFFGTDGILYISGDTPILADINKPAYRSPPHKCKDGSDPVLGFCPEDFSFVYLIGFGVLAYVGYQMFFAKNNG